MWSNILLCNFPNVISSSWSIHTVKHTACKKQNPSALLGNTWCHNLYMNWGNLFHGILMLQKTYVPLLHTKLWLSFASFTYYGMTDRDNRGRNNCTYIFIFICGSVITLSSPYVPIQQLPCGVGTVDCDLGVNLSAAHLLTSEIILILAFK